MIIFSHGADSGPYFSNALENYTALFIIIIPIVSLFIFKWYIKKYFKENIDDASKVTLLSWLINIFLLLFVGRFVFNLLADIIFHHTVAQTYSIISAPLLVIIGVSIIILGILLVKKVYNDDTSIGKKSITLSCINAIVVLVLLFALTVPSLFDFGTQKYIPADGEICNDESYANSERYREYCNSIPTLN